MLDKKDISRLLHFNPDDAVAVHGTSIQSVKILLDTGMLPSSDLRWRHLQPEILFDYKDGCLYLVPNKSKFKQFSFYDKLGNSKILCEDLLFYAQFGASRNYIISNLDFELSDDPSAYITGDGWYYPCGVSEKPQLLIEAEGHGMTETEFRQVLDDAVNIPNGVLVYMSDKLFNLGITYECDTEITVDVPDGLPLEYILGIEPLGDYESDVLNKMLSKQKKSISVFL
ncbi:MAG: hypothetical protein GQ477_00745 [Nanohaloarchaea archaeon]|nr:hypothetical protein [Candidatus Nanohaloarchaea archaeon]